MSSKLPTGLIRPYVGEFHILSKSIDGICIIGSLWLLCWVLSRPWLDHALVAITAFIVFQFFAEIAKIYRSWRSEPISQEMISICCLWIMVVFVLLLLGYASKTSAEYSRLAVGSWMITALILLCCWRLGLRIILRRFRGQGYNTRTVAIAGASESGTQVANLINASPWMGLNLVGCFDDRQQSSERLNWEGPLEGNFSNLLDRARTRDIDVVYITLPMKASERIDALLTKLSDTTTSVYVIPEPFWLNLMHSRLINLGPLPTISVFETPFYGLNGWFKRLQDIVLASIILMMISVPMLLIAIGVKLSSPGPIFFKQKRYGLDGQEIDVWKFRSMRVCENGAKVTQAKRNDHRITAFGSFLRRTSLDELPQFINVLQGDMSIVGPRPHAVAHNEQYRALIRGYMLRHKVKPGITGWAQINGWRGETDTIDKMEKRVQHDLWYIKNWSFWLDLKIIFLTLFKGFIGKNAY